jgi:DnaJ-class molecular chaperone
MRNLFEVLGVDPGANDETLKDAFHSLAKAFHPDVNDGDELAERRFVEISQAYATLKHPKTRAAYELGLTHQRKKSRRRINNAVMTGFATSMLSTIVISFMMIWLLTDSKQQQVSQIGHEQAAQFRNDRVVTPTTKSDAALPYAGWPE